MFATDDVTESAEYDGAEGTYEEAGSEGSEGGKQGSGRIGFREELTCEYGGETTKDIKIVPFDEGTQAGGADYFPNSFLLHGVV